MFDLLINEVAKRLNLDTSAVSSLVRGLLSMMMSESEGGVNGFFDRFRRAGLGDAVTSWLGGKPEARPVTAPQIESALGANNVERLASSAGLTRAATSMALTVLLPKLIGALTPTGALPSSSALLSQVSSYLSPSVSLPQQQTARQGWPRWVPWAAAALVALVGWLWLRSPAGTLDPQLTVTNTDGKVTYSGVVRDEATRATIVSALEAAFGRANLAGDLRVDSNVRRASWLPRVSDLVSSLKTPGVEFSLIGETINLGGWLSPADREALSARLRGILGSQATIGALGDAAVAAVQAANSKALAALAAVGTSAVTADTVVRAMNLAIINFPTGSAEIPSDVTEIIRRSADAIKRVPAGSKIEIGGHTDNTGDAAANMGLSQARADAVRHALVAAGVPAETLVAKGYGASSPRATNDTEFGRFQNRRIEYALIQPVKGS
jgi:OmpA-OmpF porin, OOP family